MHKQLPSFSSHQRIPQLLYVLYQYSIVRFKNWVTRTTPNFEWLFKFHFVTTHFHCNQMLNLTTFSVPLPSYHPVEVHITQPAITALSRRHCAHSSFFNSASSDVSLSIPSKPPNFRSRDSFLTYFIFIKLNRKWHWKEFSESCKSLEGILPPIALQVLSETTFSIGKLLSWDPMTRHTQAVFSFWTSISQQIIHSSPRRSASRLEFITAISIQTGESV